jgi:hypothetical protein
MSEEDYEGSDPHFMTDTLFSTSYIFRDNYTKMILCLSFHSSRTVDAKKRKKASQHRWEE